MLTNAFPLVLFLCMTNFAQAAMQAANPTYNFGDNAFKHTVNGKQEKLKRLVNKQARMWKLPDKQGRAKVDCNAKCDKNFKGAWDGYEGQFFRRVTDAENALLTEGMQGENFVCILSDGLINHIGPFKTQADADRKTCFNCIIQHISLAYTVSPQADHTPNAVKVVNADSQVRVASRTDSFVGKDWLLMAAFAFTLGLNLLFYCQRRKEEADLYSPLADLEEVE